MEIYDQLTTGVLTAHGTFSLRHCSTLERHGTEDADGQSMAAVINDVGLDCF